MKLGKNNSTNSIFCTIIRIVSCACARSPVDRTLASGAESVGSTPAERTIFVEFSCGFPQVFLLGDTEKGFCLYVKNIYTKENSSFR